MTARRCFGLFALLAMMHFIIVGTAQACPASRDDAREAAATSHTNCAPGASHPKSGNADRATELPCCAALASCATAPLAARMIAVLVSAPRGGFLGAISERAPLADSPAPELPPPRA